MSRSRRFLLATTLLPTTGFRAVITPPGMLILQAGQCSPANLRRQRKALQHVIPTQPTVLQGQLHATTVRSSLGVFLENRLDRTSIPV